jgi:hypothetical protein
MLEGRIDSYATFEVQRSTANHGASSVEKRLNMRCLARPSLHHTANGMPICRRDMFSNNHKGQRRSRIVLRPIRTAQSFVRSVVLRKYLRRRSTDGIRVVPI